MTKEESLKIDIDALNDCITCLNTAHAILNDVDDTDEIYAEIHNLKEKVIELKTQKEIALEKGAEE